MRDDVAVKLERGDASKDDDQALAGLYLLFMDLVVLLLLWNIESLEICMLHESG